ncbi:hypothetical protein EPO05_00135 [Patescibacteria group bacterium]|nr:MAG: hypothetical protein EPO05_00135 [Patescibacteria group bacterium]
MISLIPISKANAADLRRLDLEFHGLIQKVSIRGYPFIGRTGKGTVLDLHQAEARLRQLATRSSEERAQDIRNIETWRRQNRDRLRAQKDEEILQQREGVISCCATTLDEESGEEGPCTNFVSRQRAERLIKEGRMVTCLKCGQRLAEESAPRLFDGDPDWQCK